jgi:hypothetical protein
LIPELCSWEDNTYFHLITSLVIAYGRVFFDNKPIGKLGDSKWTVLKEKEYRLIHQRLLSSRNKVIAHSDLDYISDLRIEVTINDSGDGDISFKNSISRQELDGKVEGKDLSEGIAFSGLELIMYDLPLFTDIRKIHILCSRLQEEVDQQIESILKQLSPQIPAKIILNLSEM